MINWILNHTDVTETCATGNGPRLVDESNYPTTPSPETSHTTNMQHQNKETPRHPKVGVFGLSGSCLKKNWCGDISAIQVVNDVRLPYEVDDWRSDHTGTLARNISDIDISPKRWLFHTLSSQVEYCWLVRSTFLTITMNHSPTIHQWTN